MNKKQRREVANILSNDCKIVHHYLDGDGCTCAIGALALAAGVKNKTLLNAGTAFIHAGRLDCVDMENGPQAAKAVATIRNAIKSKFGLSTKQLSEIQCTNDLYEDHAERVTMVLLKLDNI